MDKTSVVNYTIQNSCQIDQPGTMGDDIDIHFTRKSRAFVLVLFTIQILGNSWPAAGADVTVPLPILKLEHVSSDHGISFYFKPNGQNTVVGISFYTPSTAVPLLKVFRSIGTY